MSYNGNKSSAADTAANIAIILLAVAIAVLLCIYFLRLGGVFSPVDEAPETVHIVSETTTAATTTEAPVITTTPALVTETLPVVTVPLGEYDEMFFENFFIVGDSLSTGFVNYEFIPDVQVFAQAGITPSSVMTKEIGGMSVYEKAKEASPEYVCIMLGTNGISYLEADYMSDKMTLFISELRKELPEAKILLVSIPPVTAAHEAEKPESLEKIIAYNEHIEKLAEQENITYVETYSILCDDTGYLAEEYAETDGLHLRIYAYPVILSRIQEAVMNAEIAAEAESVSESNSETSVPESESDSEGTTTTVPETTDETENS